MKAAVSLLSLVIAATVQITQAASQVSYPPVLLGEWLISNKPESCKVAREMRPGQLINIEAGRITSYESTSVLQAIAAGERGQSWRVDSQVSSSDGEFPLHQVFILEQGRLTVTKLADEQGPEFSLVHYRCRD